MSVSTMPPKADGKTDKTETEEKKGGKKKLFIIIGVVVLLLGGVGYKFFLAPKGKPKPPEPGEVVAIEPIQINLEGGHYLKLGLALQLTASAHEADGSKALDAAIELFTGQPVEHLTQQKEREELKHELEKELEHLYHGDVMGVYFTDFVTQ